MSTFQEPVRMYSFSDGRLIELGLEKVAFAERDVTELATQSITAGWVADFKLKILAFGAMPDDVVELSEQVEATEEKNIDADALRDKLKELRSAAKRAFGEKSGKFGQFKLKDLDDMTDGDLLKAGLLGYKVAVTHAVALATKGYDAADNTELQTLSTDYVGGLHNQVIETGSRDTAQEERVLEANEIYDMLENELCEAAKSYWRTRSAAKYNDYIIYNNESGSGAPAAVTHIDVNSGQIAILATNLGPADPGEAYVKNTGTAPCVLHIYFAMMSTDPFNGVGITLNGGQQMNVSLADVGPVQAYLLVQNTSGVDGGLDFAPLD